jgi:hypothetical protein
MHSGGDSQPLSSTQAQPSANISPSLLHVPDPAALYSRTALQLCVCTLVAGRLNCCFGCMAGFSECGPSLDCRLLPSVALHHLFISPVSPIYFTKVTRASQPESLRAPHPSSARHPSHRQRPMTEPTPTPFLLRHLRCRGGRCGRASRNSWHHRRLLHLCALCHRHNLLLLLLLLLLGERL